MVFLKSSQCWGCSLYVNEVFQGLGLDSKWPPVTPLFLGVSATLQESSVAMASVNPCRLRGRNYGVSEGWKSDIKQSRCSVCVWLNVLCVLKSSLEVSMFDTVLNISLM